MLVGETTCNLGSAPKIVAHGEDDHQQHHDDPDHDDQLHERQAASKIR